jgi:hypothetical protein
VDRIRQQSSGDYALSVVTIDPATEAPCNATGDLGLVVYDGDGVQVFAGEAVSGPCQLGAAVPVASMPLLDTYVCAWTGSASGGPTSWTSRVEVCGGYAYEIADFRAYYPEFADATKFPAQMLRAARVAGEQRFECHARVAYVPRCGRWSGYVKGHPVPIGYGIGYDAGCQRLETQFNAVRCLRAVLQNGVPMAPGDLALLHPLEWGAIDRQPGDYWLDGQQIKVTLEHGYDAPPQPVSTAVMILAREYVFRTALSSRATVESTDVGFFRLSVAGPGRPTGIPDVDTAILEFGRRRPRV